MKKDIDLLGGFNESTNKKGSSNAASLLLVIGVVAVIGAMIFMFVSGKMEIKDKEQLISNLDNQLQQETTIKFLEQKLEKDKVEYQVLVQEIVKEVYSGVPQATAAEMSSKFLAILYDNYALQHDDKGDIKVQIDSLNVDVNNVSISCKTKTYQEAWDFVDYMRGTLEIEEPGVGATEEEIKAYQDRRDAIEANAKYFSNVIESYPGLPVEGNGIDYSIGFSLNIQVDWEAMAK